VVFPKFADDMSVTTAKTSSTRHDRLSDVEGRFRTLVQSPLRAGILRFLSARPDDSFDVEALMTTFGRLRLDVDNCVKELVDFGVVAPTPADPSRYAIVLNVDDERRRLLDTFLERRATVSMEDQAPSVQRFREMIGRDEKMLIVFEWIRTAAKSDISVLILGPTGSGKEVVARMIHELSRRGRENFQAVNCAALPDTLFESEIFGYEKGAFTGAAARKQGRFERADGGTLLLDEIGEVNLAVQVKLLRVVQEREFERLGGVEPVKVNVRLIAATNKHLEDAIAAGTFREDLLYRLNVFTIFVPPLRERKTDILLLADHFVQKLAADHRKAIRRISTPAIDMLMAYHWPGNVRELQNVMERAVLVCDGEVLHAHHLPPTLQMADTTDAASTPSLAASLAAFEKDLIQDALKMARGNRAKAARLLQTTARIVNYKIRRYRIDWRRFR
jgi:Nif-specific regulatory protein